MDAYASIYEARRGHAAGASDLEKQASQLASDVRYKAKGKVKEGTNREELKKVYLGLIQSSPAPNVVKQMAKKKLIGEEAVNEMRFDDGKEGTEKRKEALRKKRGMTKDQMDKHPQFKDDMKEGSAYGIYKGDGKMKIGKRDEGEKAPRMQKGAMAYDGPNKERSEAADRVLAKAKKKREKMKEEYVDEKFGMGKLASARQKLALSKAQQSKFKLTKGQKEVLGGRTAAGMATRAGIIGATGIAIGGKIEAGAEKKREERTAKIRRQPNFTTSDNYSSYNLKLDHTPDGELIDEMKQKPKQTKNPQNMALPKGVKSGVNYQNMAQSYVPVGNIFNEKKMDPVGAEDKDIDNDGDHDKTDKYLLNRRKAIGKAIAKKRGRVKEGFSAWRIDLDFNEQVKK